MAGTAQANELASTPGVADIKVDPSKLLEVATVVEEQANALQDKLRLNLGELRIDTPSPDVISSASVEVWNALVSDGEQAYAPRVRDYVQSLRDLVEQLRTAAAKYAVSEADKAAHFRDHGVHHA